MKFLLKSNILDMSYLLMRRISVFLVLGVLGWILSTLDASLQELQAEGSPSTTTKGSMGGMKAARGGLKHRKPTN